MSKRRLLIFISYLILTSITNFGNSNSYSDFFKKKTFSIAENLNIIENESEFPEVYVKKRKYWEFYRKEMIETQVWDDQVFLFWMNFEVESKKIIRVTNEFTDRVKNSKKGDGNFNGENFDKYVINYVKKIRTDLNIKKFELCYISRPQDNSLNKFFYYFFRKYKGYFVNESFSVGLYPDGTFYKFLINATDNECPVNIQISRKEAEKIALDEIRKKAGLFNRMMLHAGKYSIEVLEKSADGRTGRFFDISKPIIIRPNFAYHTSRELQEEIENGLLKDESEKVIKHLRWGGTEKLRLAWVISLKLNEFRFNEDNNIVVCVDCETGKVLGY